MQDRALKLPKLRDAMVGGKLDPEIILKALNENPAINEHVKVAADCRNRHVLDCLSLRDPAVPGGSKNNRASSHTGHHWKNLTNVVENEHFAAIFWPAERTCC